MIGKEGCVLTAVFFHSNNGGGTEEIHWIPDMKHGSK